MSFDTMLKYYCGGKQRDAQSLVFYIFFFLIFGLVVLFFFVTTLFSFFSTCTFKYAFCNFQLSWKSGYKLYEEHRSLITIQNSGKEIYKSPYENLLKLTRIKNFTTCVIEVFFIIQKDRIFCSNVSTRIIFVYIRYLKVNGVQVSFAIFKMHLLFLFTSSLPNEYNVV